MTTNKGYGNVFRGFLKLINGQISKTFKLREWSK